MKNNFDIAKRNIIVDLDQKEIHSKIKSDVSTLTKSKTF